MLADELWLRNFLNINVVYTRKLAQSITCLSLPTLLPDLKNQVERRGCGPAEARKTRLPEDLP
jgi:hypothetical protein